MMTIRFKLFFILFTTASVTVFAQTKQNKKFTESFKVNSDVVIDINTSYTDIVFETWDKNTVEVEAVIEAEDVTKEEAEKIFKSWNFKAEGNSSQVTISTRPSMIWASGNNTVVIRGDEDFDFNFVMPEIPELPEIPALADIQFDIPEIPEMISIPPMPPMPLNFEDMSFDYEAYKKDGDAYLKEWKKKFNENFDEKFKERLESWKKESEMHKKEMEKHREEMKVQREKLRAEQAKIREEQRAELAKVREEARAGAEKARAEAAEIREKVRAEAKNNPNVFFFSMDGEKNNKVKKTIKIKMPKGAKLKMNVRHGEVKLAANYKNINATLSHTRLLASVIDGENTFIEASYSPVIVDNWNYGELKLNYATDVRLKNVRSIKLQAKSSDVIIDHLTSDAVIKGSFGDLKIGAVSDVFKHLDVILDNSEAHLVLPKGAYSLSTNASNSKVSLPRGFIVVRSDLLGSGKLTKGYNKDKNSNKTISVVATYSAVSMQ